MKRRQARSKGDKTAARELILFADNESSIYNQRVSIHKNLLKKIKAGKYSDTKAAKLWGYWFETAAKSYARQMATPSDWNRIFSAATRRLAARTYASREGRILRSAARGETDDYVYKNPRRHKARRNPHFEEGGRPVLKPGSIARWDSFQGMIPCKVISVTGDDGAPGMQKVKFKLTASRGPYKKGEVLEDHGMRVVPQKAHFQRRYGARIGYYTVKKNPGRRPGVYLAAKRGAKTLYLVAGNKFSDRGRRRMFANAGRAMKIATTLARRFPVLLSEWILYPEIVRPK